MFKRGPENPPTPPLTRVIKLLDKCIFNPRVYHWPEEHEIMLKNGRGEQCKRLCYDMDDLVDRDGNPVILPHARIEEEVDDYGSDRAKIESEDDQPDATLYARLGDIHEKVVGGRQNIKVYCNAGGDGILQIAFHRTVRVPGNVRSQYLPPSLGELPIYSVKEFKEKLPEAMVNKGGIFIPMYRNLKEREAMWMSFEADRPFAIKLYVSGVNIISGEPKIETRAVTARRLQLKKSNRPIQDYLVAGPTTKHQDWLDGMIKKDGSVAQFVAIPISTSYTLNTSITDQQSVNYIQIEILPIKFNHCMKVKVITGAQKPTWIDVTPYTTILEIQEIIGFLKNMEPGEVQLFYGGKHLNPNHTIVLYGIREHAAIEMVRERRGSMEERIPVILPESSARMGKDKDVPAVTIGNSGIQQIVRKDFHPADIWDPEKVITFTIHLLPSSLFCKLTSLSPPPTPITADTYAKLGYPFLPIYNESTASLRQLEEAQAEPPLTLREDDETHLGFPPIMVDRTPNPTGFRTITQLEAEVEAFRLMGEGFKVVLRPAPPAGKGQDGR